MSGIINWISNTLHINNSASAPVQNRSQNPSENNVTAHTYKADSGNFPTNNSKILSSNTFNQFFNKAQHVQTDLQIAQINKIPDTNERSIKFRDVFIDVLDDDNFTDAAKIINATPSPLYRNSMFKSLIQEMISSGHYETSINLINKYPDNRIKNELRQFAVNYINNNDNNSEWAAKAEGDDSFINVAKLKTENVIGSVGSFFGDVGGSVSSLWSDKTKSQELAQNAHKIVGKQYRQASLDYGNKACAYAVSQMLKTTPGFEGISSAECNELARQLKSKGFSKAYDNGFKQITTKIDYKPGDVVFFTRSNKQGYGHVGMVAEVKNGVPYMIHNSSSKREVIKVRLDQYYKTPVAVFRK